MAYNEHLPDRINRFLKDESVNFYEKKMFWGLCFMQEGKMFIGIIKNELMARIGTEKYAETKTKEVCNEMTFTGRPMKGYVYLDDDALDLDTELEYCVQLAVYFNLLAKATKEKTISKLEKINNLLLCTKK